MSPKAIAFLDQFCRDSQILTAPAWISDYSAEELRARAHSCIAALQGFLAELDAGAGPPALDELRRGVETPRPESP